MSNEPRAGEEASAPIPLGQRLFDNWALLMVAGIVIMLAIYTGWGIVELMTMPPAELP